MVPAGRRGRRQPPAVEQAGHRFAEHASRGGLVEAGLRARRAAPDTARWPAGRKAGLRRTRSARRGTRANSSITSSGKKQEMSYSTPGWSARREVRMPWSQIAPWARINTTLRMAHGEVREPVGERRQSPPGMDQDRDPRVFGEREDGPHLRTVEDEVLRARMQLDPARAGGQAAFALVDRIFGGVQAAERGEPAVAFRGPCDDAVVGDAIGGLCARDRAAGTRTRAARRRRRAGRAAVRAPASVRPRPGRGGCVRR